MSTCPTLAALRAEAARVFGAELVDLLPYPEGNVLTLVLTSRRIIDFTGRSKAAARRLALETLQKLPDAKDGP